MTRRFRALFLAISLSVAGLSGVVLAGPSLATHTCNTPWTHDGVHVWVPYGTGYAYEHYGTHQAKRCSTTGHQNIWHYH